MANIFKSKYTGEQIEEILDKANNVTDITPNPEAEATDVLQKITIGNTTFSIPQGVSVEGNPSGDATVELTKLKVGDTIYSIPQNSGGGSGSGLKLYFVRITVDDTAFRLVSWERESWDNHTPDGTAYILTNSNILMIFKNNAIIINERSSGKAIVWDYYDGANITSFSWKLTTSNVVVTSVTEIGG